MDVQGKTVVVTGGASGIGRSLCLAFGRHGASGVVVADIDGDGAAAVAAEVEAAGQGAPAAGVAVDVSNEKDVQALVARSEELFGPVDIFFSNAGIYVSGGADAPDDAWERIWAINVLAHVYAARALVPGMLERGSGYLLSTASAAGLLTQLGSAPYSVTKHAAVALAEWLSITYGDRGIRVSCLCPQAVTSNLAATSARVVGAEAVGGLDAATATAPASASSAARAASSAALDGVLDPDDVAEIVLQAVAAEQFLILPHAEVATYERRRSGDRERWLGGMRRLQARLLGQA